MTFPWLPSPVPSPPRTPEQGPLAGPEEANPMLVMKFGGSSLATLEHLRRVADIVRKHLDRRPVLVLSAMGKQTNELLAVAEQALETGTADISKVRKITEIVFEELKIPV